MQSFSEIIERIKLLKNFSNDYQVAEVLGIKSKSMATAKMRNSMPYEELTSFCDKEKISLNWLLFGTGPKTLADVSFVGIKEHITDYNHKGAEPPRHPAAVFMPVPDLNVPPGVDPAIQAMADIKEIFDSGDPILIPAIQANLHAFKRALLRERQFEQILKENEELKSRISKLEMLYEDLKIKFEVLLTENQELRAENKKLQDLNGGSAPINLNPGNAAPTGTEDQEM